MMIMMMRLVKSSHRSSRSSNDVTKEPYPQYCHSTRGIPVQCHDTSWQRKTVQCQHVMIMTHTFGVRHKPKVQSSQTYTTTHHHGLPAVARIAK